MKSRQRLCSKVLLQILLALEEIYKVNIIFFHALDVALEAIISLINIVASFVNAVLESKCLRVAYIDQPLEESAKDFLMFAFLAQVDLL